MDKILLITEKEGHDKSLIDCLKSLFPECEIEIHPKQPEISYYLSPEEGSAGDDNLDKRLNELLNLL